MNDKLIIRKDPISVIFYSIHFNDACDLSNIHERPLTRHFTDFTMCRALAAVKTRLNSKSNDDYRPETILRETLVF